MPVRKVMKKGGGKGYQFGSSGKVYSTKKKAVKQAKAIYASGYKGR